MTQEYLKNMILRLCSQPRTFEFISKNSNGLDPIVALEILNELEECGLLVHIDDLWVIKEISINANLELYPDESKVFLQKYMGYFDFLKTPHPLDFEWRNSTSSLNRLVNRLLQINNPSDKILLLGMPTLFATAILRDIPNNVNLIEKNKPIVQGLNKIITDKKRFNLVEADIFTLNPLLITQCHCVVMDPPWYTPHFLQFMWLAAKCTKVGGVILISLPPINTRPKIIEERLEWFSYCKDLGLCLETLDPQQLQYAMPFFEFNALRAGGVTNILPFWRKGDLAIFRKIDTTEIERPKHISASDEWNEREFDSVRIRVKLPPINKEVENDGRLIIESIVKGDILPSVSNRDGRRQAANIWTSGNRIFTVNNPSVFLKSLDNALPKSELETTNNKVISDFISMVSGFEKKEFKDYLDWIYYEMERQID